MARINSAGYKARKLVAAQRWAEHKADTKQEIGSANPNNYAAARQFLDSLAEEAQHPSREEPPDE